MNARDVKKRQRLLLEFLREQTCNGKGFPVELKVGSGEKVTGRCLEVFIEMPLGRFQNTRAKELYQKIKEAYGINGIGQIMRVSNNRITVEPSDGRSLWDIFRSDLIKLQRDNCVSFSVYDGISLSPNGLLVSDHGLIETVHVEAKGDEWLDQTWVHRFYDKHPLLVKLSAPALVVLGAVLAVVLPKLWEWLWPSPPAT